MSLPNPGVTFVFGEQPTAAKFSGLGANDDALAAGTGLNSGVIGNAQVATGVVVQVVDTLSNAVTTGTTIIPLDNTIPQNTEGDQYMSLAVTPKASTNKLIIEASLMLSNSAVNNLTTSLFQDSGSNALAADAQVQVTAGGLNQVNMYYSMTAGTTSSTTFKVRAGGSAAGTTTFNGSTGAGLLLTVNKSFIRITEVKV